MSPFDSAAPEAAERAVPLSQSIRHNGLMGLVVLLGCCFGLQYAAARMMGLHGVEPLGALFAIHIVLSATFVCSLAAAGLTFRPQRRHLLFFAVVAGFTNLGQLGVELIAGHHVPAGELTLIVSLLPVFVLIIAAVFRTEALSLRKCGGMVLGVAASTAILLPGALEQEARLGWTVFTFLAPLCQAFGMVMMAKLWPAELLPSQAAAGNLVMGTLLLAPVMLLSEDSVIWPASWAGAGATALFGLTMAGEFLIFSVLVRKGGAVLASCADFVAVAAGLGLGAIFFGEVPTQWMAGAALLCLAALRLAAGRPA